MFLLENVQTQWRTSQTGLVGLDYTAVFNVAHILGVDITISLLKKLQAYEKFMLRLQDDRF